MSSVLVLRAAYLDDSNTLGHMTGYILTSAPLGRGGWNPYDIVPTCLLQAGDHLFHDEVLVSHHLPLHHHFAWLQIISAGF